MTQAAEAGVGTVRERLDRALLDYLASLPVDDISDITVDAVAQLAGVSRATAYRYLGSRDDLLYRAAIALAQAHLASCAAILNRTRTVAERIEESFAYTVRETQADQRLQKLLHSPRATAIDEAVRSMAADLMKPAVCAGQQDGQVRTDVSADDLIMWMIEQLYVVDRVCRTEDAARQWVRRFVIPVFAPHAVPDLGRAAQVRVILDDATRQLALLDRTVAAARSAVGEHDA